MDDSRARCEKQLKIDRLSIWHVLGLALVLRALLALMGFASRMTPASSIRPIALPILFRHASCETGQAVSGCAFIAQHLPPRFIPTARASLFVRDSSGVVRSANAKALPSMRRCAKWNCIHQFYAIAIFGISGSFENSSAFVQTLVQSMRLDELQLSHRPVVIGVKWLGLRSRPRHAICLRRRAYQNVDGRGHLKEKSQ